MDFNSHDLLGFQQKRLGCAVETSRAEMEFPLRTEDFCFRSLGGTALLVVVHQHGRRRRCSQLYWRDPSQDVQGSQIGSKRIGGAGALIFLVEVRKILNFTVRLYHMFAISLRVVCGGVFVLVQYPEKFCLDLRVIRASDHPMRLTFILENVNASIYINVLWRDCECTSCKSSSDSGPHVLSQEMLQKCAPETR